VGRLLDGRREHAILQATAPTAAEEAPLFPASTFLRHRRCRRFYKGGAPTAVLVGQLLLISGSISDLLSNKK
jgi:hypothetical protein